MLRSRPAIMAYPSRTVLADVLLRYDEPDKDSYTPFMGLGKVVEEQFRGKLADKLNVSEMIQYIEENDFDPKRIMTKEQIRGIELIESENAGFIRLEDLINSQRYVKEFLISQIIGYKKNANSPFNKFSSFSTYTFIDEDNDETEEKDLLRTSRDYDVEEFRKAINEIPYLLKIIHNASKQMNAHLFSFLRAYILITRRKNRQNITPQDFAQYSLYRMKTNGAIDKKFDHIADNKGMDYPRARKFILGEFNKLDPSYKACMKLAVDFEIIGLNIENENPAIIDDSFIRRLVCTYMPDNDEYVGMFGSLDPELVNALQPENLFERTKKFELNTDDNIIMKDSEIITCIRYYLQAKDSLDGTNMSQIDRTSDVMRYISKVFDYQNGNPIGTTLFDIKYFSVVDNILMYKGDWFKFTGQFIGKDRYDNINTRCIFTSYGYCILLESSFDSVRFVTIDEALERFEKVNRGVNYDYGWFVV